MRYALPRVRSLVFLMAAGVFASFLMFYPRPVSATLGGVDPIRLLRGLTLIGVAGLGVVGSVILGDIGWLKRLGTGPVVWYSLYLAWAAASIGFSGDAFLSAAKVFELGVSVMVVAMVMQWIRSPDHLDQVWRLCMTGIAMVAVGYIAISMSLGLPMLTLVNGFPKYSGFGGGTGGANGMAQIGSVLAIFGISRAMAQPRAENKLLRWLIAGLGLVIMLIAYSRSSMGIFAIALLVLLARSRRYLGLMVVSGSALVAALAVGPRIVLFLLRGQDWATFLTLTGRVNNLWAGGLVVFFSSPWIGHGYYYATTYLLPLELANSYEITISNVDNTFLEVAMNLGVVGLIVFVGLWVAVFTKLVPLVAARADLWRIPMFREGALLILATFIRSWVNPTIAYHHWNTFTFLVAVVIVWRCADSGPHLSEPERGGTISSVG